MFMITIVLGCGKHIEAVLKDVPMDQRCQCKEPLK